MKPLLVLVVWLILVALPHSAHAQTIKTYNSKAAFLADTGATSATGALPNVGKVVDISIDPLGTYTLGSLTFGLTVGSDNIAVGAAGSPAAPDWYPPTATNEIALGFERMQVSTAGPVFSIGFDFIEPDATVQPWGGIPEEATFEILLFNGPALVGQAQFPGSAIPNDVLTFLGVWSDKPFDRVLINDTTGNDDDEYFGEFYTGVTPFGCTLNLGLTYWRHAHDELRARHRPPGDLERLVHVWRQLARFLWSLPVPAISPAVSFLSRSWPPLGNIGVLTTLNRAGDGILCSSFKPWTRRHSVPAVAFSCAGGRADRRRVALRRRKNP